VAQKSGQEGEGARRVKSKVGLYVRQKEHKGFDHPSVGKGEKFGKNDESWAKNQKRGPL